MITLLQTLLCRKLIHCVRILKIHQHLAQLWATVECDHFWPTAVNGPVFLHNLVVLRLSGVVKTP